MAQAGVTVLHEVFVSEHVGVWKANTTSPTRHRDISVEFIWSAEISFKPV